MTEQDRQRLAALLNNYKAALHAIDVGPCALDDKRETAAREARDQIFIFFGECSAQRRSG